MESLERKIAPLRIAITGPECSGKTYLAEHLAKYYESCWVPEMAREYLPTLGRKYRFDDLLVLSRLQMAEEEKIMKRCQGPAVFCDTELINIKIWSEYRFGKVHEEVIRNIEHATYDFYFLMYPDIPWEYDPLRENPDDRLELFAMFEKELHQFRKTYFVIQGSLNQRLHDAIYQVDKLLKAKQ